MPRPRKFRQRLLDALQQKIVFTLGLTGLKLSMLYRDDILNRLELSPKHNYTIEEKIKYYYKEEQLYLAMRLHCRETNQTNNVMLVGTFSSGIHCSFMAGDSLYSDFGVIH